jgi:tRNA 2-thiouridine synthesizing protein C
MGKNAVPGGERSTCGYRAAMTANTFLLSTPVTLERLSWIEECLKFFFIQLYPETLMHQAKGESPIFTFLLTGDALYSLDDPETQQVWAIVLSLSSVRLICDKQELDLRGISVGKLQMKYPDQVITANSIGTDNLPTFWKDVIDHTRQTKSPLPGTVGWLQTESPYMHRSAGYGLRFLSAALEDRLSIELYAYLDGIHMGHIGQAPTEDENVGKTLEELDRRATKYRLECQMLACNRNAAARGYSTWDDGQGVVISTSAIRHFRIRDLNVMIDRFCHNHPILSPSTCNIQFQKKGTGPSFDRAEKSSTAPPVTILITQSPYSTEIVSGAIALATACAYGGILTRVIFMEAGIYTLTGIHRAPENSPIFNLQDMINTVAGSENLHFFAFTPSFQKRGVVKDKSLNGVLELGYPGLGKIFFYPPGNVQADHQRVFVF